MKLFALSILFCLIVLTISKDDFELEVPSGPSEIKNPLKFFNKCISDHECKPDEYCDHVWINPFGSCTEGKKVNDSCLFDRHCKSKNCYLFKCVTRKPVRDGPCTKDAHSECLPEQYCSSRENTFKCRDRKCSGVCAKDAHCLSNKCSVLFCKKPEKGCNQTTGKP